MCEYSKVPLLFKYNSRGKLFSTPSGGFLSNGGVNARRKTQFNNIFAYILRSFLVIVFALPILSSPDI